MSGRTMTSFSILFLCIGAFATGGLVVNLARRLDVLEVAVKEQAGEIRALKQAVYDRPIPKPTPVVVNVSINEDEPEPAVAEIPEPPLPNWCDLAKQRLYRQAQAHVWQGGDPRMVADYLRSIEAIEGYEDRHRRSH